MFSQALSHLIINSCSGLIQQAFPAFSEEEDETEVCPRPVREWGPRRPEKSASSVAPHGVTSPISIWPGCVKPYVTQHCDSGKSKQG